MQKMPNSNPVAKHLKLNRPQVVKPKKGKGSYKRRSSGRL